MPAVYIPLSKDIVCVLLGKINGKNGNFDRLARAQICYMHSLSIPYEAYLEKEREKQLLVARRAE